MFTGETRVYGLFGFPIGHSLSPIIFNRTFEKLSLDRAYLPFEVSIENLKDAVEAARTLGFDGFNITIPHKTRILEFLDRLDESAKEKRSVNTVVKTKQGLVGYNTDGEGAIRAIKSYGFEPEHKQILIIGAGGAARALVHSLATQTNLVKILNRTLDRAREIAENIDRYGNVDYGELTKKNLESFLPKTNLIVNATPLQTPTILRRLNVSLGKLTDTDWVFDLAYEKPAEPVPTKHGRISALEMLLHQAALSYEIWLEKPAPVDLMRSAMVDHLGRDWK